MDSSSLVKNLLSLDPKKAKSIYQIQTNGSSNNINEKCYIFAYTRGGSYGKLDKWTYIEDILYTLNPTKCILKMYHSKSKKQKNQKEKFKAIQEGKKWELKRNVKSNGQNQT